MTNPSWYIFIALALVLIVLTLWSSQSRQHEEIAEDGASSNDGAVAPPDPPDPRRKFSSSHDLQ